MKNLNLTLTLDGYEIVDVDYSNLTVAVKYPRDDAYGDSDYVTYAAHNSRQNAASADQQAETDRLIIAMLAPRN